MGLAIEIATNPLVRLCMPGRYIFDLLTALAIQNSTKYEYGADEGWFTGTRQAAIKYFTAKGYAVSAGNTTSGEPCYMLTDDGLAFASMFANMPQHAVLIQEDLRRWLRHPAEFEAAVEV